MSVLSVLDQSPIRSGGTAADAIRETLELAQVAERRGYHRYWLAEHHNSRGLAGSTPEVLIGLVAAGTRRIRVGAALSFAHFIDDEGGAEVTRAYAERFRPSPHLAAPRANIAVFVVCAETEAEAKRLALSRDLFLLWLYTGGTGAYPSVGEAEAYRYTARERAIVEYNRRRTIAGAPEQVKARLLELGGEYGVDEFVIVTITHHFKARLRSYELLAEVCGLERRGSQGTPRVG